MRHYSVWIVIALVALLTVTKLPESNRLEEVAHTKALSRARLTFYLSQTSEEITDGRPVAR